MQFDVFVNPIAAARRAYPHLVVLQSDIAQALTHDIVAPIVPRDSLKSVSGRMNPGVSVESVDGVVLVSALTTIRRSDLKRPMATLASERDTLLAAVDYLFFGV